MQEGDSRDAWPAEPRFLSPMQGHRGCGTVCTPALWGQHSTERARLLLEYFCISVILPLWLKAYLG